MEIDPVQVVEDSADDKGAAANARLNAWVAITVALLATFMAVCKIKDDNICQAMQQAQANRIDDWGFYQARNLREEIARATLAQLAVQRMTAPPAQQATVTDTITKYQALVREQDVKKKQIMARAQADGEQYDALNYRDDQFDLSDAMLAIAISLLAMTALTHLRWLYAVALIPTAFGVLMGLAGLLGWHIHPDALSALLS